MMVHQQQFDFRTSGPPLPECDRCQARFTWWEVATADWNLVPEADRRAVLCTNGYGALLRQGGHDPASVRLTHQTSRNALALWAPSKDEPADRVHLHFPRNSQRPPLGETMGCQVVRALPDGQFHVRLRNDSPLNPTLRHGTAFLAEWNGATLHGITGRLLLDPVRRLPAPRKPQKRKVPRPKA